MAFAKKDFSGVPAEECNRLAFERIARSVSASEQSSIKMRKKLESAGYPADSIDYAINKAVRIGAIDDKRYSECLIRSTIASGKGLKFALKEIEDLGIDPNELESYCEYLDQGEDFELERALDFLRRHRPKAKDLRGSCYRKLVSRGFSSNVASSASRVFVEELR